MSKDYITIIGYDLTNYKGDKYEKWIYDEEADIQACEDYFNFRHYGCWQMFNISHCFNDYIYFGYITNIYNKYDEKPQSTNLSEIDIITEIVKQKLFKLIDKGVIEESAKNLPLQIISFVEHDDY